MLEHLISEGVYDPSIFKAIFVVGGIGSGKSYVTSKVTGGHGLKLIDVDRAFELLMNKRGLSLKMPPGEEQGREDAFSQSRVITRNILNTHLRGRLGMIITGTGSDYSSIEQLKNQLETYGYDTFMIFVNTSLEKSMERNNKRYRTIPDNVTRYKWNLAQENIGKFQSLMGMDNMIIVDNTNDDNQAVLDKVWKTVMKFVKRPVRNSAAFQWVRQQMDAHNRLSKVGA